MEQTEVLLIYDVLLTAAEKIFRRSDDWSLELKYMGQLLKRNEEVLFRSEISIQDTKIKQMKRKEQQRLEQVLRLVNLPSLVHPVEKRSGKGGDLKGKRKKENELRFREPGNRRTLMLGQRRCLGQWRLKPLGRGAPSLEQVKRRFVEGEDQLTVNLDRQIVEEFSRTLARPAGVRGECLSVSGRIASNYTPLSRYLHVDFEKKKVIFLELEDPNRKRPWKGLAKSEFPKKQEIDEFYVLKKEQLSSDELHSQMVPESQNNRLAVLTLKVENYRKAVKKYKQLGVKGIPQKALFPLSERFLQELFERVDLGVLELERQEVESNVRRLVGEIRKDYSWSVRKAIMDYVLKDQKQRARLGLHFFGFDHIREWGEPVSNSGPTEKKDASMLHSIQSSVFQRESRYSYDGKAKEVRALINSRFSILNDTHFRKSSFSMFNGVRTSVNQARSSKLNSNARRTAFGGVKEMDKVSSNDSVKDHARLAWQESGADHKVVALVNRENFKSKVHSLGIQLTALEEPVREIQYIRNYFKYDFDREDKLVDHLSETLSYRHIRDLVQTPHEIQSSSWQEFMETNLSRLKTFKTHIIHKWMEEVANVYQTSVLGKKSKVKALRLFDSIAGLLSLDLREIVVHCLTKLRDFFQQFDGVILSPRRAINNVRSTSPLMPSSCFSVSLRIKANESTSK